ncbi:hypothetical protein AX16_005683 [Volvariella volvacea WC 439]|nr:hypothetical protein AX16_005683 [Volvariella volvacea WC 439]
MVIYGGAEFDEIYPENLAITKYQNHFESFADKTIVFDGTLFTRRFFHSSKYWVPEQSRHILGWYKLITTLRRNNVAAICVFDGKQRNEAKAVEVYGAMRQNERRRSIQDKNFQRAMHEKRQLAWYERARSRVGDIKKLEPSERMSAWEDLKGQLEDRLKNPSLEMESTTFDDISIPSLTDSRCGPSPSVIEHPSPSVVESSSPSIIERWATAFASTLARILPAVPSVTAPPPDATQLPIADERPYPDENIADPFAVPRNDEIPPGDLTTVSYEAYVIVVDDFDSLLSDRGLTSFQGVVDDWPWISLTPSTSSIGDSMISPTAEVTLAEMDSNEDGEKAAEQILSRRQMELIQKEDQLLSSLSPDEFDEESILATLEDIVKDRQELAEAYEQRAAMPKLHYFADSMELLRAMGVPCIIAEDGYEGEALAASIVKNGLADYVASEDLDVVVYEAPLIRHIDNEEQMMVISGVRQALKLTRHAWVDFALLTGTDFCPKIDRIAVHRAYKMIQRYGNIEKFVRTEHAKYPPPLPRSKYFEMVRKARRVFKNLPPPPPSIESARWDQEKVVSILSQHGLGRALQDDPEWDGANPLRGNYFEDNPAMIS